MRFAISVGVVVALIWASALPTSLDARAEIALPSRPTLSFDDDDEFDRYDDDSETDLDGIDTSLLYEIDGTDGDGIHTPYSDHDGIDTPLTDNDGFFTPATDYDGVDTPLTDADGIDTPIPTDNDGIHTPYTDYDLSLIHI